MPLFELWIAVAPIHRSRIVAPQNIELRDDERMFDAGDGCSDAQRAVGAIREGIDDGLAADLALLSGAQVLDVLRELEIERRRIASFEASLIADVARRGLAQEYACTNTATLLSNMLNIDTHDASGRVKAATELAVRHTL